MIWQIQRERQRNERKKNVRSNRNKTRDIVLIGLFAVLMAICSWISIPTVIPFTMQTFAVFLTLNFLGGKKGTVSVCIYLLLGLIGLPVYANFTSGIGILMGTTGGYMIGWILSGLVMWLMEKLIGRKLWAQAVSMLIGLIICYMQVRRGLRLYMRRAPDRLACGRHYCGVWYRLSYLIW